MRIGKQLRDHQRELQRFRFRLAVAGGFVLILFVVLASRFVYLQVMQHDHYLTLAENNRISVVPVPPNRGVLYDRNGVILAHNYSAYTLEITPSKVKNLDQTITDLSKIVEITAKDRKQFHKALSESHDFETLPIRTRLTEAELARFAANRYRFPGVEVHARLFRDYPLKTLAAHAIGYIGRINDADMQNLDAAGELTNYRGTMHIGKIGIEQSHETELHGITGYAQVETDAGGKAVRTLSRIPPISGNNLFLTLDSKLQKIAEDAFGNYRGAVVAINPTNGEILAFVSQPSFDPNLFVDGIDSTTWNELNTSIDKPLNNRALRGVYPPGSTFKPFMAVAGLELGKVNPNQAISDPGFFSLPGSSHRYRDWKAGGHGMVDLHRAIVVSCDTYFYRLANDMGIDTMHKFISQFGFGSKTGIDIDGELPGLLPSPEWKWRRFKQRWFPGETVIAGIGQGYVLATPLQLAFATATLANHGQPFKPHLVRAIQDSRTLKITRIAPQPLPKVPISEANWELLRNAMVDVNKPGGTASSAWAGVQYEVAGKTGTAQVVGIKQGEKYEAGKLQERHRDHALYIAFAPADKPTIAVGILVENGGHGGSTAAPIVRKMMDYYLLGKEPDKTNPPLDIHSATAASDAATDPGDAHD